MSQDDLDIRVLGGFEVRRDGRAEPLPRSKKARGLLGYLVVTGRAHARSHLCDLLWDDANDPRAGLRWALSKLRPVVNDAGEHRLASHRDTVRLVLPATAVDLDSVRARVGADPRRASAEDLKWAAGQFRGEFLEGLDLPECPRYHAWWLGEREKARRLRISVLATLGEWLLDRPGEALPYVFARLSLDPYSEAAYIPAVRLLGALGRVPEALRQYERCRKMLAREFGAAPSPALEEVRRSMRPPPSSAALPDAEDTSLAPAAAPPSNVSHPPVSEVLALSRAPPPRLPPVVGREPERAGLRALVETAGMDRAPEPLLVLGEPGIGKTRLLQEFAAEVQRAGGTVLAGRAFETETARPYGAWIDALRSLPAERIPRELRTDLATLLPELGPRAAGLEQRTQLFDAVARLLQTLAAASPAAVVLDDLHWLDEASVALTHYLLRLPDRRRVLLACAARPVELAENRAASRLVRALRGSGQAVVLEPARLDREATAALARWVDARANSERVFAESEGNPLFVMETARALAEGGEPLTATLDRRIEERLTRLDELARRILPWATALGRSFRLETVRRVTGASAAELIAALGSLERQGVIYAERADAYDFTHDLIRRAAYQQISPPARRVIHLEIARALNEADDPDGVRAGEIARHAQLGGDPELAARACAAAGRRALRLFAYEEAAALIARGLTLVGALPRDPGLALQMDLLEFYAHPGMAGHRPPGLLRTLEHAIEDAGTAGLHAVRRTGHFTVANLHYQEGSFPQALEATLQAEAAGRAADPGDAALALADTARCLALLERDFPRVEALAREAADLAARTGRELHEIPLALGMARHHTGRLEEAVEFFAQAARLARRSGEHWWECCALSRAVMVELDRGCPGEAIGRCTQLLPVAERMGKGSNAPFARGMEALARLALNEPDAAQRLDGALDELRRVDSQWMIAYVQTRAAELDLAAGHVEAARERAEEALRAAELAGRPGSTVLARVLLARCAAASGDPDRAATLLGACRSDDPNSLSALARAALAEADGVLAEITTDLTTPAPTRG